jgi:hypothetical protein
MTLILSALVTVAVSALPTGIQIECRSWTAVVRTKLTVTVVAADGSKNIGMMDIARDASSGAVQDCFVAALEQDGWVVKPGPNDTVLVFAPKGQTIKSITFDSTGWFPVYKRVLVPPPPKP